MRLPLLVLLLGVSLLGLLAVTPGQVDACPPGFFGYGGMVSYYPAAPVYYSYSQPVYYSAPAYYYSPPAPCPAPFYGSAAPRVVEVGAYDKVGFKPKTLNIAPGTTVRWVNHGQERHTVTSRDGLFDSGLLAPGASYSVTFTRPGTFHYFCRPHEKMGMVGTVVVGSGGSGGAGPSYGGSGY